MTNLQVTVCTTAEGSDIVSCILLEAGSEGVAIKDPGDVLELIKSDVIWDYIDESLLGGNSGEVSREDAAYAEQTDKRVFVSGFFGEDADISGIIAELEALKSRSEFDVGSLEVTTSKVKSEDYENVWKQYYKPIEIGKVVIVPKWIKRADDGHIRVLIDPGMAFGTGNHETTSMCIRLLDGLDLAGKTVCDLGCGSGILGITAAKLGAKHCVLSDIDPQAVEAATANVKLNCVGDKTEVICGDLNVGGGKFDVVVANITADVLIRLSEAIGEMLGDGGSIILSGIINARAEDVLKAYNGYEIVRRIKDGEWQAFLLK